MYVNVFLMINFQSENVDCDNNPVVVQVEPDEECKSTDEHTEDAIAEPTTTFLPEPPGELSATI